jgi:uncharacterized protein YcgL (UPF0745 family)
MHCDIYKASTRDEMYVYIARPHYPDDTDNLNPFSVVPAALRQALGRPRFVMHLELSPTRKLSRVPVQTVLAALHSQGFFVQMPPEGIFQPQALPPEGLRGA